MTQETSVKLFESKKVRTHWDEKSEKWYFSVIDVVEILTDSINPRDYWFKMKQRIKNEDGLELSTICRQLKTFYTCKKGQENPDLNYFEKSLKISIGIKRIY
jgi:hypothetical protein